MTCPPLLLPPIDEAGAGRPFDARRLIMLQRRRLFPARSDRTGRLAYRCPAYGRLAGPARLPAALFPRRILSEVAFRVFASKIVVVVQLFFLVIQLLFLDEIVQIEVIIEIRRVETERIAGEKGFSLSRALHFLRRVRLGGLRFGFCLSALRRAGRTRARIRQGRWIFLRCGI